MNDPYNPDTRSVERVITGIIERQLRDGEPPETRQTYERLRNEGYPERTALRMIGAALVDEINHMMGARRTFDREHFRSLLERVEETYSPIVDKVST